MPRPEIPFRKFEKASNLSLQVLFKSEDPIFSSQKGHLYQTAFQLKICP